METEIEKMSLESKDLVAERIEQMKALFPEIITEGEGSIDFERLRLILGDEVDEGQERYAFTWPGKADAIRQAQIPSTATLRPDKESSVDWDTTENLYIEGDNLEVLKLLQRGYHGKVKMIYIDPPYNTGHDFVYKDSFQDSIENYKEQAGLSGQSNADTSGRYHSDWLSMMYPRLRLARELVAMDGAVFISIDEAEIANLREIGDEVFGPQNFIAQMIWSGGRKNDSKYISVSHEYVLCYAKSVDYLVEHGIRWRKEKQGLQPIYAEYERLLELYDKDYSRIKEGLKSWYKALPDASPSKAHKHYSSVDAKGIYFPDNISWPGGGGPKYEVLHPVTHKPVAVPTRGWLFGTPERMQEIIDQGLVEFGEDETKVPCYKRYLKDTETEVPYSVIYKDGRAASKRLAALMGNKVFDNPKDEEIIAELISYIDTQDSLIMDFFSGSGTTAHSVMMRNAIDGGRRRFVLVQLPENLKLNLEKTTKQSSRKVLEDAIKLCDEDGVPYTICSIAEKRIRRAGQKIKAEIEEGNKQLKLGEEPKKVPDIGFRVLKLDSSNFDKVEGGVLIESIVKAGRTYEDIIFEMMVKWGLDLSLPMEETEVLGYPITSIAADELICCMDEGLTIDVLEAIAELEPKRVFFLDSILTDTVKLNAAQIFKRASERAGIEIELRTV